MKKDKRTAGLQPTRYGELFRESDMTQIELAQALKTSTVCIYKWMWGIAEPSPESLRKLSELFNVSADWMLGLTENRERR